MYEFSGDAHSHNFPSVAQVNIEVRSIDENTALVALSSSDGTGSSANATAAGNGKWIISEPIFMGTGWGASSDPFTKLSQQRTLIISKDGMTATYQDMGADFTLHLIGHGMSSMSNEPAEPEPSSVSRGGERGLRGN